ncbi:MAG: hypothetical protein K5745_09250 [Saccharofermentans sp.]|nr:hypothetical protein [Saccharofermentans sp.]
MSKAIFRKITASITATVIAVTFPLVTHIPANAAEQMSVDGDLSDWDGVTRHTGDGSLTSWAVIKDDTGYYFLIQPAAYQEYSGQSISIDYGDGTSSGLVFNVAGGQVMDSSWASVPGGSSSGMVTIDGTNYEEFFVPASYFTSDSFSLVSGETVASSDISTAGDTSSDIEDPEDPQEPATGVYDGIVVDGSFDDWDSVVKTDATNASGGLVNGVGMVWDGDYIYLYIDESQSNSASWSGVNNNGNFVIRTDTDHVMIVNFENNNGQPNVVSVTVTSTGVKLTSENGGVQTASNSDYSVYGKPTLTEIAIPTSALPDYKETISFGYYLSDETIISDVANLNPVEGHYREENDGSDIVIDGQYEDWKNYPVTTIEYATAGTNNNWADSEAGIYTKDGLTYVYAEAHNFTQAYTNHYGGEEFLEITVTIAGKTTKMHAVLIGDDGSLDWDAYNYHFDNGTYHFALFEQSGNHKTKDLDNIDPKDYYYGDMYVTVGGYTDKTEFVFDPQAIADYLGVSLQESDKVDIMLHRCGDEHLQTSGVSTGPVFAVLLAGVACGSFYLHNRKRKQS